MKEISLFVIICWPSSCTCIPYLGKRGVTQSLVEHFLNLLLQLHQFCRSHAIQNFGDRGCSWQDFDTEFNLLDRGQLRQILQEDVKEFTYYLKQIYLLLIVQGLQNPFQLSLLKLGLLQGCIFSMKFKLWKTGDSKGNSLLPTVNQSIGSAQPVHAQDNIKPRVLYDYQVGYL